MKKRFEAETLADELARLDANEDAAHIVSCTMKKEDFSKIHREMHAEMERLRREYPGYGHPRA